VDLRFVQNPPSPWSTGTTYLAVEWPDDVGSQVGRRPRVGRSRPRTRVEVSVHYLRHEVIENFHEIFVPPSFSTRRPTGFSRVGACEPGVSRSEFIRQQLALVLEPYRRHPKPRSAGIIHR
jgi:hypothetical protein